MNSNRRDFLRKTAAGAAGITIGGIAQGMSAKSYSKIIGANDRLFVAIVGLGRRYGAYIEPITLKKSNTELLYLCDVMQSQRERAAANFAKSIDYKPKLENDIRKVLEDPKLDLIFNSTPDHWHAPGTFMAVEAGKHVYVEKPCSHNPLEGELLIAYQKKYGKVIQMGNQQRSSDHTIEIIKEIHKGTIGKAYKAVAFYTNNRGRVVNQRKAPVPAGLDWDLFQGPAPRREYTHDTWNYNWHWYGWDYGTAEMGNNATHELDVARWALQVDFPEYVFVEADKRHYLDDGWEMYDTMDAMFRFPGNKIIKWDGRSRTGYDTYGGGRGTIIYGSEGTVFVNRSLYKLFDLEGKLIKDSESAAKEAGNTLGGGGGMTTLHVQNFFNTIRGTEKLNSPIDMGVVSQQLTHYANISYRINKPFEVDAKTGHIFDREAMKLWKRKYEPGWEPKLKI
jgi:predicted dehydrogenase